MGERKQWHFAHKADEPKCNPNNALHESAKEIIAAGFHRAVAENREYPATLPCTGCENDLNFNLAEPGAIIAMGKTVVAGTRSDLIISEPSAKVIAIIEVVVHHDLEKETEEIYRSSGVLVIRVEPSWDNLRDLWDEVTSEDPLNTPAETLQTMSADPDTGNRQGSRMAQP